MEYISVKEAAKLWGYSEETVRKWCRDGKIVLTAKAEQNGKWGKWRIPKDAPCPKPVKKGGKVK